MYKLNEEIALVQTIDFFTPIVDDPRIFGRAAAANSLSDVYAMGARPITAMNVVCFPTRKLGVDVLRRVLEGGMDVLRQAGVSLIGGHSVEDDEPKYGMSVLGLVHPQKIMKNSSLKPGDRIILTKPVGAGIIATQIKAGMQTDNVREHFERTICALNDVASEIAVKWNVQACTDVTGFGLAGHLTEMAVASKCRIRINSDSVPLLEGAFDAASMGLVPAGAYANRDHYGVWVKTDGHVSETIKDLMFDPQTSGGLLMGVPDPLARSVVDELKRAGILAASIIGAVIDYDPDGLVEIC